MKKVVSFDEVAYDAAINKQNRSFAHFEAMRKEAEKHIKVSPGDIPTLKAEPVNFFKNGILKGLETENIMKLSFDKLCYVKELDFSPFFALAQTYTQNKVSEAEIRKEDYEIYANTPQQIERLEATEAVIQAANQMKKYQSNMVLSYLPTGYGTAIRWNSAKEKLEMNNDFVLNGH